MKFPSKKEIERRLSQRAKLSEQEIYILSIIVALIIVTSLLVFSYNSLRRPNGFISFSVLNAQREASYPELLVIGQNNTCQLWLLVENHMETSISGKVLLKIIDTPISTIPVLTDANESYEVKVDSGKRWEKPISITIEKTGDFHLIFELWIYNREKGNLEFSDRYLILNVEVKES